MVPVKIFSNQPKERNKLFCFTFLAVKIMRERKRKHFTSMKEDQNDEINNILSNEITPFLFTEKNAT